MIALGRKGGSGTGLTPGDTTELEPTSEFTASARATTRRTRENLTLHGGWYNQVELDSVRNNETREKRRESKKERKKKVFYC